MLIGLHSFGRFAGAPAHQWVGDVFFLLAATCYASFGLLLKQWHVSPLDATIGIAVISMACYTTVYLLFLPKAITTVPASFVLLQGVYQGILAASIAGLLFAYAIHNIGPQRATLMLAMVPGISAVAAVPLLRESRCRDHCRRRAGDDRRGSGRDASIGKMRIKGEGPRGQALTQKARPDPDPRSLLTVSATQSGSANRLGGAVQQCHADTFIRDAPRLSLNSMPCLVNWNFDACAQKRFSEGFAASSGGKPNCNSCFRFRMVVHG